MNVLEKILEEIEEKTIIVATSKEYYNQPQNGEFVEEVITIKNVEDIIRSHMDELPNTIQEVSKEQLDQVLVATPEFLQECKATAEKYEKGKRMEDNLERARLFAVRCWMGFGCGNLYKNGFKGTFGFSFCL